MIGNKPEISVISLSREVKDTSRAMEEVANSMSINLLIRDIRDHTMMARGLFPKSLNW